MTRIFTGIAVALVKIVDIGGALKCHFFIGRPSMRYLLSVTIFASLMFAGGAANAQITLGPGQSQTITCSSAGGGGAIDQQCVQQLQTYCYNNTSGTRDSCYATAIQYCPSPAYVTCVEQTQNYCYRNTSGTKDSCFKSALQTCRGNHSAIRELMDNAVHQARVQERAVHAQSEKSE